MITSITLKKVATYSDTGVIVDKLSKLNYFFGNNGSGKSTLGKYLQSISETSSSLDFSNCRQDGFDSETEELLVFNELFIKNNFNSKIEFPGVFSLNKINSDIDEKIKANEIEITAKSEQKNVCGQNNNQLSQKQKELRKNLKDTCFSKRNTFKTFSKVKLDYAGNKEKNLSAIEAIIKGESNENVEIEDLTKLYKKLYEEDLTEIDTSINLNLLEQLFDKQTEIEKILGEIIVGKEDVQIAKMIQEYNLKSWVLQGKSFLDKTKNICPFCQKQTIDESFIAQLDDIFDESSKQKVENIKKKSKRMNRYFLNFYQISK